MKFLTNFIAKYRNLDRRLGQMTSFKDVGLASLFAVLTAIATGAPFVLALIALFTFTNLLMLWIVMSFIVLILILFSYYFSFYFYIKKLNPKVQDLKTNILLYTEFVGVSVLMVIVGIIFVWFLLGGM